MTYSAVAVRPTWRDLCSSATRRLGSASEARWMAEEATGCSWGELLGRPAVADLPRARFNSMVERRLAGEPLQYVLGSWSFRGLDLMVDRRVLIPRPETEQVVESALEQLETLEKLEQANSSSRGRPSNRLAVVDLGTGSGAIALSIAVSRPGVDIWATDLSEDALDVAGANLAGLGGSAATRVLLAHGRWWNALPDCLRGRVDLAVSNPPYISTAEIGELDRQVVDWEPRQALEAGPTGLESIGEILSGASEWMRSGGTAVIEIAPHQALEASGMALRGGFTTVSVRPDLAGRDRVLVAQGLRSGS